MHTAKQCTIATMKPKKKNINAAKLGRLGGVARRKATTKAQRAEIARKAANARWNPKRGK